MKNSPLVQQAYNSWQQNPADPAMAQSFIASVQSEKSRFGISSQKVLPDSIAQAMAEGFNNNKETTVESIRQQLNAFGHIRRRLADRLWGKVKMVLWLVHYQLETRGQVYRCGRKETRQHQP
jgi:hypothetical protein